MAMLLDRNRIAQTGDIGDHQLFQDVYPLEILNAKSVVMEDVHGRKNSVLRMTGQFQRAGVPNSNGRIYPRGVLEQAVRDLQPDIKARKVLGEYDHPCLSSPDFRVLTLEGWKEFKDIKVGDRVWSRKDGKAVVSRVNEIIDRPYKGPVYHVKNSKIDSTFTPGHKFFLLKRPENTKILKELLVTVEEIANNRTKYGHDAIPKRACFEGEFREYIVIPGIPADKLPISVNRYKNDVTKDLYIESRLFCAFMGLYLAEGFLSKGQYGINIAQVKDWSRDLIYEEVLRQIPELEWQSNDRGFYASDIRLYRYLSPLGNKYTKHVPKELKNLDSSCLQELLYWFMIGDGRAVRGDGPTVITGNQNPENWNLPPSFETGTFKESYTATLRENMVGSLPYVKRELFTVSKRLIQDLHECLIRSGGCGTLTRIDPKDDYLFGDHLIKAENKVPLYQLHISSTSNIYLDKRYMKFTKKSHDGNIYCLSVDHGNFYMEQNGHSFWTGNSDAKIHLDRASHLITELWMKGDKVFGECEVLEKTTYGAQLKALLESNVQIGISSRGVGDMETTMYEGEEYYSVLPGYCFVTFDTVCDPSVKGSTLTVMESRNRLLKTRSYKVERERELLKEFRNILRS